MMAVFFIVRPEQDRVKRSVDWAAELVKDEPELTYRRIQN